MQKSALNFPDILYNFTFPEIGAGGGHAHGHGHFSASAAPLISASSRELARKTSVLRHTPGGGLCSLLRRKMPYRPLCMSSCQPPHFIHYKRCHS